MTLNGTTDIMPFGQTAPGLQVPKLVVPMKGSTLSTGRCARQQPATDSAMSVATPFRMVTGGWSGFSSLPPGRSGCCGSQPERAASCPAGPVFRCPRRPDRRPASARGRGFAVELPHLRAQLNEQRRHNVFAGRRDAAADDDQAVGEGHGRGHGVAGDLAQLGERGLGGLTVALALPVGDLADLLGLQSVVGIARGLAVDALHGAHGHALFDDDVGHLLVTQAERLDARVVAAVQFAVHHHTHAESRAEGVAQQVLIALRASGFFGPCVHLGQGTAQGLAVGEQVAVVVDEDRNAERHLEERPQRYALAERREVREIDS